MVSSEGILSAFSLIMSIAVNGLCIRHSDVVVVVVSEVVMLSSDAI